MTATGTHLEALTWQAHPAREQTGKALLGGVVILAASMAARAFCLSGGASTAESLAAASLSAVVLVLALNRFFFPSRFHIDEEGITARFLVRTQRMRWRDVRRFVHDEHGGYLSTRAGSSRLDAWRGMHLLFGRDREAIIAAIRSHLPDGDQRA